MILLFPAMLFVLGAVAAVYMGRGGTPLDDVAVEAAKPVKPVKPANPGVVHIRNYQRPSVSLLDDARGGGGAADKSSTISAFFGEFGIPTQVVAKHTGPTVTLYELRRPEGIKINRLHNLTKDLACAVGSVSVRLIAPMPDKTTIGVEIPNDTREMVGLREILGANTDKAALPLALGKDAVGAPLIADLASMPHLLMAGTTGSGKSVCINSMIMSLLMLTPNDVRLILVDPKRVEMSAFAGVPHLLRPIITETSDAKEMMEWATFEMDRRYGILENAGAKHIREYRGGWLPYIVIVVDEMADLMMTAPTEMEACIVRLAQKSRAVGIHLVLTTQRPQASVVTGLIKANMPCRISFQVASKLDSRIILDCAGAECLLGNGDMLFLKPGTQHPIRAQGVFVSDNEISRICNFLRLHA